MKVPGDDTSDANAIARQLLEQIWSALGMPKGSLNRFAATGSTSLPSVLPVTDLAVAMIGAANLAVAELAGMADDVPRVLVDRRLSSLWFQWSLRPLGWTVPLPWDPVAGDYKAADRWIRLHTNAPKHRAAAMRVLQCEESREAVAEAVGTWVADELEKAVIDAGGCAATMRSQDEWAEHPQGRAVSQEPIIAFTNTPARTTAWRPARGRPLDGLRVLDLTRVLAGPVATRFLAGYGADVLRMDPPDWNEPGAVPEVTLGKRCVRLDLTKSADRVIFEDLLASSDILVHGLRPGALEGLGYGDAQRQSLRPGLIEVALDAYGWTGPWAERRGFDSLVQMSAGLAEAGMQWRDSDKPVPLPVQALDQATGYLMAASAVRGVIARLKDRTAMGATVSLARTASLLGRAGDASSSAEFEKPSDKDYGAWVETTDWGPANRVLAPAIVVGNDVHWDRGASDLGSALPVWLTQTSRKAL